MNHQQRVAACHKVSDALLEKYRDEIIATAAIGSVARGEDLEHSDVDFHAVVKDGSSLSSHVFMLNRCLFGVHVRTESSWIREPEEPNRNFPVVIGSLESMMVIHDPSGVFGRLRERARNIPDERWKDAVRGGLEGICEDLSRLKKYHAEEDWINFRLWSPFLAACMPMLCSALNRRVLPTEGRLAHVFDEIAGAGSEAARKFRIASGATRRSDRDVLEAMEWLGGFLTEEAAKQGVILATHSSPDEYIPP